MYVLPLRKRPLLLSLIPALLALAVIGSTSFISGVESLSGQTIVIDADHGGIDPGGNRPGIEEKDINLAIALELRDILCAQGATVVMTRDRDMELSGLCDNPRVLGRYHRDLAARMEFITESRAQFFISIHANVAARESQRGTEVFYSGKSATGKVLAECIHIELKKVSPPPVKAQPGNFFVLRRSPVPAVLVEVGYLTNAHDRALLAQPEHRHKLAGAIAQGVSTYNLTAPLLRALSY